MKNKHKRRANGFGLVETLLTLGALSALSLGIYLVLSGLGRRPGQARAGQSARPVHRRRPLLWSAGQLPRRERPARG